MQNIIKSSNLILLLIILLVISVLFIKETEAQKRTYTIGDKGPAGGWIFYDKGKFTDGWQYLEAAPKDQSESVVWGCSKKSIFSAKQTAIGRGKSNTQAIIKNCGEYGFAAKVAASYRGGGKKDWFLPSRDELDAMIINLYHNGIGDMIEDDYWSSSEHHASSAWTVDIMGFIRKNDKNYTNRVRAIRAF